MLLALTGVKSYAQEFHFSQYMKSPMVLNPALTGAFYGDWQVYNNYRSQWGGVLDKPYTTIGLGFQKPIYLENNKVAFGLFVLNDQAGDKGYMTNMAALSLAYHASLGYQELRVGAQFGYTMRSIDDNLAFPEDFNRVSGQFEQEVSDMEPLSNYNSNYFDVNLGLVWSLNYQTFRPEVGIAAHHINKPKEVFFANESTIGTKVSGFASFKYYVNRDFYVDPNFLVVSFEKATNMLMGVNAGFEFAPNKLDFDEVFGGILIRNGFSENPDAFIIQAGVGISNFDIALNYDFNISPLKQGLSNNGSFEVSLSYTAASTRLIKTKIESERL